jgi:hypothetical protein
MGGIDMIALFSLFPIFAYAIIFNIFFKKTVSSSIFFSITSIVTMLFIFGMNDILKIGGYLLFYGGILLLLLSTIIYTRDILRFIKSVPFVIYLLSSSMYLYFIQDAQLFFWDEYSHWGVFIKEMYYFHTFYDATSVASHINYPPGISVWDYFIVMPTGFNESSLYFAYFLIIFSSTLMMYEKLSFRHIHWIILIFSIQMIIFANFGHWFSSIYVDHVVGSLFAGLILSFFVDKYKPYELFLFTFPLITIVLVKEIGLYFGLAYLGLVLLLLVTKERLLKQQSFVFIIKQHKHIVLILFALFLAMILSLKLWEIRQEHLGVKKEQQTISSITKAIFSEKKVLSQDVENKVKKRFLEVVLHQQLHKEKISLNYNEFSYKIMSKYQNKIKLSTVGSFLFFIVLCLVAFFITDNRNKKIMISIITGYLLFVGLTYLMILYLSFLVAFGDDALRIPSYVRYMNIAVLPLMIIGFGLFLPLFQGKKIEIKNKNNFKYYISGAVLLLSLVVITKPYLKPLYTQLENPFRSAVDKASQNIIKILPPKTKLFIVFPVNNSGSLNNILKYSFIPLKVTISDSKFSDKTFAEMQEIYRKYEYVWFSALDNKLFKINQNVFKMKGKKQIFTLYKIDIKNNKIEFKPVL